MIIGCKSLFAIVIIISVSLHVDVSHGVGLCAPAKLVGNLIASSAYYSGGVALAKRIGELIPYSDSATRYSDQLGKLTYVAISYALRSNIYLARSILDIVGVPPTGDLLNNAVHRLTNNKREAALAELAGAAFDGDLDQMLRASGVALGREEEVERAMKRLKNTSAATYPVKIITAISKVFYHAAKNATSKLSKADLQHLLELSKVGAATKDPEACVHFAKVKEFVHQHLEEVAQEAAVEHATEEKADKPAAVDVNALD